MTTSVRSAILLGLVLALPASDAMAQAGPLWRTVDVARQLRDTLPQRIRVQYGAGKVSIRGTDDPLLYSMRVRYDESRAAPIHRHDAEQRSTLLGLESRGRGLHASSDGDRDEVGAMTLALPTRVPLELDLELGGTQTSLELGGLALRSVRIECGATEAALHFSTPNRTRMRELDIGVGAAELTAVNLANANADLIRLRGGVGVVDLDFGGTWSHDLTVTTRLAVGKLTIRIPSDVGVRLEVRRVAAGFDHEGFERRDDAWYSRNYDGATHKLRLRAETYFGKIEIRHRAR